VETLIYGAGAVGLGIGSCLVAAGHRVRFVTREATVAALRSDGLLRTGLFGRTHAAPERFEAVSRLEELTAAAADYVLVTTKSFDSERAARALAARRDIVTDRSRIVLCQNGWGNAEHFARVFAERQVWNARVITGFRRPAGHHVEITVHAEPIHVGSLFGGDPCEAEPLCAAIRSGGIPCEPTERIADDLWAKMLYNCCLNPLGALFDVPYGALADSPHSRGIMAEIAAELFAVMAAAGYRTRWERSEAFLADFYEKLLPPTRSHESSTLVDLRTGKRTEIEALNGAVVALAARFGIPVPANRTILEMIRFIESRGPRSRPAGQAAA
jgi:2-dehydropantoate 2-reductase